MDKVALVILNWNGESLLDRFLPSIFRNTNLDEAKLYVIDNHSTDNSINLLHQKYPEVNLIELDDNYGFAEGYNKGLKNIDAKYYLLLNSDIEVTENWLDPLIQKLDESELIDIVQPKILSEKNKEYFEYAGASGGFIDRLGFPFCRGRIFDTLEKDQGQYNADKEIFWASGACFAIRSTTFHAHGGFDPFFFAHMEEIDLCWRVINTGKKIYCVANSRVYHVGGATLDETSPFKTYLNYRNNMLMIYKNLPVKNLKKTILKRRFYNFVAALQSLLSGKKKHFQAIVKADRDFMKSRKQYQTNNQIGNVSYENIVYKKNIVIAYYLYKKKKFVDLDF